MCLYEIAEELIPALQILGAVSTAGRHRRVLGSMESVCKSLEEVSQDMAGFSKETLGVGNRDGQSNSRADTRERGALQ
jgi:hypothetical protein